MLVQVFSGLGLSSAAGLNAYIPLLAIGILGRMGIVHLDGPYAILASWPAIAILAVVALINFVADKVPAVDHAVHAVGIIVNPAAGAIVFASQTQAIGHIPPAVALAAGLIVAGSFHATRTAVRPVATVTTGGVANPFVSLAEDAVAVVMSLLSVFFPIVAFLLFLILTFLLFKSWAMVRRGATRLFGSKRSQTVATKSLFTGNE